MQTYLPGTRIGQYEIASRPMMGGMGVVYFALDHGNGGRPVAIKTFRPELLPDRTARDRFLREGTAWVELGNHPHIVRCYKVEYIDPTAFLVLELIAKEQDMPDASLRSWLIPGRPLPIEQALLFALQIARGMQHATEKIPGFVHRDLKPENILVGADKLPGTNINRLRVTDFGLVKTIASDDTAITADNEKELKPNQVQFTRGAGTPLYMAPEQWKGEPVGMFTDIYAFGCILYEMLSGYYAVDGKTISQLQASHCAETIKAMPESLPQQVKLLLGKCLAKKPNERFENWQKITISIELAGSDQDKSYLMHTTEITNDLGDLDRKQASWSYHAMGMAYSHLEKNEQAVQCFDKMLSISREVDDHEGQVTALANLGVTYKNLGDTQRAIKYYEQALEMVRGIGEHREEGRLLVNLGVAHKNLGNINKAIEYYEQCLQIARELDDKLGESAVLSNLGVAHQELGDMSRALDYYEQGLKLLRERGDLRGVIQVLSNMGLVHQNLGNTQLAIHYYEQSRELIQEIGDKGEDDLIRLGVLYAQMGLMKQAINCYGTSLEYFRNEGKRKDEGTALNNIGEVYRQLGDTQRAIVYFEQALTIARQVGDRYSEGNILGNLGASQMQLEFYQKGIDITEQALVIMREVGDFRGEGGHLTNLGSAYLRLGDIERAKELYERAIVICHENNHLLAEGIAMLNAAQVYAAQGLTSRALSLAEDASRIFEKIGSPMVRQAQVLATEIQDGGSSTKKILKAFASASSLSDMQAVVAKYPFMREEQFIRTIEKLVDEQIPAEHKSTFEQCLTWLRQIANQK